MENKFEKRTNIEQKTFGENILDIRIWPMYEFFFIVVVNPKDQNSTNNRVTAINNSKTDCALLQGKIRVSYKSNAELMTRT